MPSENNISHIEGGLKEVSGAHGRAWHVAWCGPISLRPLRKWLRNADGMPEGYVFPLGAHVVEGLLERGHRVTVVSTQVGLAQTLRFAGDHLDVVVVPRRAPRQCARDFFRQEVRAFATELRRARPDLVHAQWTYEFADGAMRSGLPTLVTAHDSAPAIFGHIRDRYRFVRLIYSYWVVPRIRNIAVPSPYLARQYRRWYRRGDCAVVPNGLHDGCFRVDAPPERNERTRIVAITGWDDRKNPKTLLQAFAHARKSLPNLRLTVIGGGFDRGAVGEEWARNEGLHHGVDFRGLIPHDAALRVLAEEADMFVHTTREESFCMAIVEAMAAGVPVVAGRRSGAVPWILGEGRFGILVDVDSPEAVAAGIVELANHPARGNELATSALRMAREKLSLSSSVSSYLDLYGTVLRSARDEN